MTTPADAFMRQQQVELVVQAAQKAREERLRPYFSQRLWLACCAALQSNWSQHLS